MSDAVDRLREKALALRMTQVAKFLRDHPPASADAFTLPSGKFRRAVVALTYEGDEAWVGQAINIWSRNLPRRAATGRVTMHIITDETE
jgi:hypothetical protein